MEHQHRNKRTETLFYATLRHAFWGDPLPSATKEEWRLVLVEAVRQATTGVVGNALLESEAALEKKDAMEMLQRYVTIQRTNARLNKQLQAFVEIMKRLEIAFIVVKGQIVARTYPFPGLRQCGDIDLYCPPEAYEKAVEVLPQALGIHWKDENDEAEKGEGKHVSFVLGGVVYELHNRLADQYYPPHQRFLDELIARGASQGYTADVLSTAVPTLPPTLHALYIFIHIFGHYLRGGIGMRQLCDLALWIHGYRDKGFDARLFVDYLQRLGLRRAFAAFGWIMVHRLGLPEEDLPVRLTRMARRRGQRIEGEIFLGGNFGQSMSRRVNHPGLLHSLESALLLLRKVAFELPLAPMEMLCLLPDALGYHIRTWRKRLWSK